MARPASFTLESRGEASAVRLSGAWTAAGLGDAGRRLARGLAGSARVELDTAAADGFDTAGALAVHRAAAGRPIGFSGPEGRAELFRLVAEKARPAPKPGSGENALEAAFARLGGGLVGAAADTYRALAFLGRLAAAVARTLADPRRVRWAACVSIAERAGLDAAPIVVVTSFFIGAVVGFLGADQLSRFGAQVFAVDLIGIAVMREFNVVITSVLLAGRSASSFAAELGAMKMNQEVDAMTTIGVDPFEALVIPRFVALLVTMPLLTFLATLSGLAGGMIVSWWILGLSPQFFIQRLLDYVGVTHFWVGMSKVPVMAAIIAGVGCRQGLEVGGDVESLGRRVTTAVVHAIFAIILIDAVFALIYMKLEV